MLTLLAISLEVWQFIIIIIGVILITGILAFFLIRKLFQKQLEKNPPINEDVIRAMMSQMGRTPSEKQVRAVMRSVNEANNKKEDDKKKK